jgi:uncharacterized protein YegP (UPF0339 family)
MESHLVKKRPVPSFLIFSDDKGHWRWNFAARDGKVVAASTVAYKQRQGCARAIRLLKGDSEIPILVRETAEQPAESAEPAAQLEQAAE